MNKEWEGVSHDRNAILEKEGCRSVRRMKNVQGDWKSLVISLDHSIL